MRLRELLLSEFDFLLRLHVHRHYDAHDVIANEVEHLRKQLEGFALIFLLRIFLRVTPQMNTLAQMVKRRQMLTPVRIDTL